MIPGEAYLLLNVALCACALLLGGRLAGLSAPAPLPLLWAALLSGLCALLALLPPPGLFSLCALTSLPLGVWLCYGKRGATACVRCAVTTVGAGFLCGGAICMLLERGTPPPLAVAAAMAVCMLLYMLAALLPAVLTRVRQVEISLGDRSVMLPAMLDSGNLLRDPLSGLPVLVAPRRALDALLPDGMDDNALTELPYGFRLLRVRTAAGEGLMPLFRPKDCRLYLDGRIVATEALVAVAGHEYAGVQALVPLAALADGAAPKAWKEEAYEPFA